jgi:tetratricopeptide (TPR) repeat protein
MTSIAKICSKGLLMTIRLQYWRVWQNFCILLSASCAHKSVTFKTAKDKATVIAVPFDKVGTEGPVLGETPLTVSLDAIQGKVLRMEQPGRAPLHWVILNAAGDTNEVALDFSQVQKEGNECQDTRETGVAKAQANRVVRMLLRAYQALSENQSKIALELADQAITYEPTLAGPYIVKGLAQLQQGDKKEARGSFTRALALDPEDRDLATLLKAIE